MGKKAEIKPKMNERFLKKKRRVHTPTHTHREEQTKKKYQIEVQRMFARILYSKSPEIEIDYFIRLCD